MKRRFANGPRHDRWLVSYADFVTLLFGFFVVMFASSQVDRRKMGQLAAAIQSAFQDFGAHGTAPATLRRGPEASANPARPAPGAPGAGNPGDLARLQRELAEALAGEIKRGEVALSVGREGLVISLREIGFFSSGSATIKLKSEPSVARIARVLETHACNVRIEGHTDNVPIRTTRFASNWELSTARATAVARLFMTRYGFPPERLSAAGFAEFHPVASNENEQGRALNRRVDIVVVVPRADLLGQLAGDAAAKLKISP